MKQDIDEDRTTGNEIIRQVDSILEGMKNLIHVCQKCGPDEFYTLLPTIRNILFQGKPEFMKIQGLSDLSLKAKFSWTHDEIIHYHECIGEINDILVDMYKEFMKKEQRISRITTPTTVRPTKGSNEDSSYEEYSSTYEDSSQYSSIEDRNI